MVKNILIVASLSNSLINFRGDLILDLTKNGYRVFTAAPDISSEVRNNLIILGATPISFKLNRTAINLYQDLVSIFLLKKIILDYKIDLVFPYTIKPVIYGSIASRMVGVPVISLITGLGFTFSGASRKANFLQQITKRLYRFALRSNKLVIFQNEDDLQLFKKSNILSKDQQTTIVNGSGVNLNRYPFRIKKANTANIKFVIVARLIKEKGIQLFMDSATALKKDFPNAEFHVIGGQADPPSGINVDILEQLDEANIIVYHGLKDNIPQFLKEMDVFVLPTFYREGVPRSILEALSVGLPIITTDMPGCKKTVIPNKNGFLVPPKSFDPLLKVCRYFLENPSAVEEMGRQSRLLAERKFDVEIINRLLIEHIKTVI